VPPQAAHFFNQIRFRGADLLVSDERFKVSYPYRPSAAASAVPPPRGLGGGVGAGALGGIAHPPEDRSLNWPKLIRGILNKPARLELVFQPIVSLAEAEIVGYEALARFPGPTAVSPDRWFAAADELGLGAELESLVVSRCLELRTSLPPNCFLTINVSPHLVTEPALANVLLSAGDLAPLVLELTEHQAVQDLRPLVSLRDVLAERGAFIALDDAGSGYSGLHQIATLRPHLIKLDRVLVADIDRDEIKLALAELLGQFASRLDAWLLAEGVETWGELEAFLRLGVPLGQGYLLGRPAPPWAELDPLIASRLRASNARVHLTEQVASLVESVPVEGKEALSGRIGMRLDSLGRPATLLLPAPDGRPGPHRVSAVSLRVPASASVVETAQRLVNRPESQRFDPVVCVDDEGQSIGIIRVERILMRLAELNAPQPEAHGAAIRGLLNETAR
jgi:EAL domain-containing protein (putative c-di-GMP-specific phosphodiesterase class I)